MRPLRSVPGIATGSRGNPSSWLVCAMHYLRHGPSYQLELGELARPAIPKNTLHITTPSDTTPHHLLKSVPRHTITHHTTLHQNTLAASTTHLSVQPQVVATKIQTFWLTARTELELSTQKSCLCPLPQVSAFSTRNWSPVC